MAVRNEHQALGMISIADVHKAVCFVYIEYVAKAVSHEKLCTKIL